jgi:hypothetical protein
MAMAVDLCSLDLYRMLDDYPNVVDFNGFPLRRRAAKVQRTSNC